MKLQSIDPTTGELIESFDEISDAELEAALARAQQAFRAYRTTSFAARAGWTVPALADAFLAGGARFIQVRAKTTPGAAFLNMCEAVVERARVLLGVQNR